jgi:hypothetical protein
LNATTVIRVPIRVMANNSSISVNAFLFFMNQLEFLLPSQLFDLIFPFHCVTFTIKTFGIYQLHWQSCFGVFSTTPFIMISNTLFNIIRITTIKGVVPTNNYVTTMIVINH